MNNRCVVCELDVDESNYPEGWFEFTFVTDDDDCDPYLICLVCRDKVVAATPCTVRVD